MLFLIFLGFIQKDIIYLTCSSRKAFLSHNWFKAKAKLDKSYEHLSNLRVDIYMKLWGEYFAEYYNVFMTENIHMRQLAGKSLRRIRLHNVALYELPYASKIVLSSQSHHNKLSFNFPHEEFT